MTDATVAPEQRKIAVYSFAIHKAAMADINTVSAYTHTTRRSGSEPYDWQHSCEYEYRDGTSVTLTGRFSDSVILPASPGFRMLSFFRPVEDDPHTFDIEAGIRREPVIGWEMASNGGYVIVAPITTSGCNHSMMDREFNAVQFPDGAVEWREPWGEAYLRVQKANAERDLIESKNEADWISKIRQVWAAQIVDDPVKNVDKTKVEAERLELWNNPFDPLSGIEVMAALDSLEAELSACSDEIAIEEVWIRHDLPSKLGGKLNASLDKAIARRLKAHALERVATMAKN